MDELLKKLSSYNIFNYLLPGVLFAVLASALTDLPLVQADILLGLFLYYFFGLVISRIGSLIVEPVLRKLGFVTYADYPNYVKACSKDELLPTLSEANNMYRTICAMILCIGAAVLYNWLTEACPSARQSGPAAILTALFLLFLFSFRKQSSYITNRVNIVVDE